VNGYKESNQQGFILVMVLFFLFIISLMTLSILSSSYLELRMSQNMIITAQQFQAAEAGLKLTEHRLTSLSTFNSEWHEYFNYAGFQISSKLIRHLTSYCINQSLAYIYDVIVQAKQMTVGVLTLKTTYVVQAKVACRHKELTLTKNGRSSWRELSSTS
jgi:Tfp pilus assembly protein PilX